jgi:hypothetical protein
MNERIRELMWDAGLNSNYVEGFDSIYSEQLEKFAKLIVKECAHLVGGYIKENEFGTDVKEAYEEITKHFGVES